MLIPRRPSVDKDPFVPVAMTRPKRCLVVIGDSETVSKGSKFLKRWMEFLEENADLRYPNIADLNAI